MLTSVAEFPCESPPHHALTGLSRSGERCPQPVLVVLREAAWRIEWAEIEQNPRPRWVPKAHNTSTILVQCCAI